MRKQKIFIALGIILIIILVLLAISRKNSSQTSTNSKSSLGPSGQIINLLNQDLQFETESTAPPSPPIPTIEETEEPNHQSGSNLFDLTEIKLSGQQKPIFQVINKFEEAFNQRDFPKAFEYFDAQVRNKALETQIANQNISEPISFKVLSIELRADGTAIAEVKEIRKAGIPLQRFFEFAPAADKYLITSYYDPAKVEVYSGFQDH